MLYCLRLDRTESNKSDIERIQAKYCKMATSIEVVPEAKETLTGEGVAPRVNRLLSADPSLFASYKN